MAHSEIGAGELSLRPPIDNVQAGVADLTARYDGQTAPEIVRAMIEREFPGEIAVVLVRGGVDRNRVGLGNVGGNRQSQTG